MINDVKRASDALAHSIGLVATAYEALPKSAWPSPLWSEYKINDYISETLQRRVQR